VRKGIHDFFEIARANPEVLSSGLGNLQAALISDRVKKAIKSAAPTP
jgi:hypothetical protein